MDFFYIYFMGEEHAWGYYGNGKGEQSVCEYMNVNMTQRKKNKALGTFKLKNND